MLPFRNNCFTNRDTAVHSIAWKVFKMLNEWLIILLQQPSFTALAFLDHSSYLCFSCETFNYLCKGYIFLMMWHWGYYWDLKHGVHNGVSAVLISVVIKWFDKFVTWILRTVVLLLTIETFLLLGMLPVRHREYLDLGHIWCCVQHFEKRIIRSSETSVKLHWCTFFFPFFLVVIVFAMIADSSVWNFRHFCALSHFVQNEIDKIRPESQGICLWHWMNWRNWSSGL